jgi:AraC family transcriptional regulator
MTDTGVRASELDLRPIALEVAERLSLYTPAMNVHVGTRRGAPRIDAKRSHELLHRVLGLLDLAARQLQHLQPAAKDAILQAASLLKTQTNSRSGNEVGDGRGRLLAWQASKVRQYIDEHITSRMLVTDLCLLIQRSEAHFSRAFKLTFGEPPHAFVIRRRLELAAQTMLETDRPMSEIAMRCGFADQSHLCKHFHQATGHTPAAWRRAQNMEGFGNRVALESTAGALVRPVSIKRSKSPLATGSRSPRRERQPEHECGSQV